jgi:hypothetical protein
MSDQGILAISDVWFPMTYPLLPWCPYPTHLVGILFPRSKLLDEVIIGGKVQEFPPLKKWLL